MNSLCGRRESLNLPILQLRVFARSLRASTARARLARAVSSPAALRLCQDVAALTNSTCDAAESSARARPLKNLQTTHTIE